MIPPPKYKDDNEDLEFAQSASFDVNPSEYLPCSPESYSTSWKTVLEILEQGLNLIQRRKVSAGLKRLQESLEKIYLNRNILAKMNNFNTEFSHWKIQFAALYNLAYAYSHLDNDPELISTNRRLTYLIYGVNKEKSMKRSRKISRKVEKVGNNIESQYLQISKKLMVDIKKSISFDLRRDEFNFYARFLSAKALLFSCFKLSRTEEYEIKYFRHQQAFILAEQAKEMIVELLKSLEEEDNEKNCHIYDRRTNEKIEFRKLIEEKAFPIIQQIKKDLSVDSIQKCQTLKMIKNTISCWKKNPQHSKKDLKQHQTNYYVNYSKKRKMQKSKEERSLLGVKAISQSSKNLLSSQFQKRKPECIKEILALEPITMKELQTEDNITYEVTREKLNEKLELLCAAYFCMGIQLWNIETEGEEQNPTQVKRYNVQFEKKDKEIEREISEQMYKKSELYLLKAIAILVCYLTEYEHLLDNLIEVYQRKFQGQMMVITEENSKYEMSASIDELRRNTQIRLSFKVLEGEKARDNENFKNPENFEEDSFELKTGGRKDVKSPQNYEIYLKNEKQEIEKSKNSSRVKRNQMKLQKFNFVKKKSLENSKSLKKIHQNSLTRKNNKSKNHQSSKSYSNNVKMLNVSKSNPHIKTQRHKKVGDIFMKQKILKKSPKKDEISMSRHRRQKSQRLTSREKEKEVKTPEKNINTNGNSMTKINSATMTCFSNKEGREGQECSARKKSVSRRGCVNKKRSQRN